MAFTATLVKNNVMGNERVVVYNVTTDAASGVVATPLGLIDFVSFAPISMATAGVKFKINLNITSAASNGVVFVSSAASADNFFLTVYGRS